MSEVFGVGVVQSVDAQAGRVTIAYEPIEGVNWPAGTMPFAVTKSALLEGVTVGEKVVFRLESQQIAELRPFAPRQDQPGASLSGAGVPRQ
jgi:Cu/Ag efflux protein CusF